jgi:LacI family transcriptional regulator
MYTRRVSVSKVLRANPLVLMNCLSKGRALPSVVPDELQAGRTAVRHLLDHGHRDGIYLIGETPADIIAGQERREGIESALAERDLALAGVVDTLWWPKPAQAAVADLLARGARPRALICLNDRIAFGAYQALRRAGLSVPEDVSIIAFDDSDLASWLDPGLTSIALPHLELGRQAVDLLLAPELKAAVHRLPMALIERGSVAPPRPRRRSRS